MTDIDGTPDDHRVLTRAKRLIAVVAVLFGATALLAACLSPQQTLAQDLVNTSRKAAGRKAVVNLDTATTKAQTWAEHLAAKNSGIVHSNLLAGMSGACAIAENITMVTATDPDVAVRRAHRQFLDSPTHKANMINPIYTKIGVGIAKSRTGVTYVVEVFAKMC